MVSGTEQKLKYLWKEGSLWDVLKTEVDRQLLPAIVEGQ